MKKIILIFSILLLSLSGYAQNIQVSDTEYKNYISSRLIQENNLKQQINNVLNDIEFKNNEFVILSGKLSSNNELANYDIKALNTSDDKANLIIKKLNESKLVYNYIPDIYNPNTIYDEFNLYIGAKPQYEANKGFVVLFNLTNEKLKQDDVFYKGKMDEYYAELYYKFYPEYIKIKKEFGIPDDKMLAFQISVDKNGNLLNLDILNSINKKTDDYMVSVIKKSSPFKKLPNSCEFSTSSRIFSFGDVISNKVKKNINNTALMSKYFAVVKTTLNKRGDVVFIDIVKSSGNNSVDEELINAFKKTNLVEIIKKYDNEKHELYLNIKSLIVGNEWIFIVMPASDSNITNQKYIDWQPYIMQAENQAKAHWKAYAFKSDKDYRIIALMLLNKNGELINRSIIQSSGINEADNAVLKSIDDGIPYPKFPEEYKGNIIPIELTFDYHIASPLYNQSGYYSDKPKSKYQELMQKSYQQQMSRPSVNNFNSNQDFLLRIKEKSESKK